MNTHQTPHPHPQMALIPSSSAPIVPNKYKETDTSPERTRIWTEPPNSKLKSHTTVRRYVVVPVIYYLSRNGHLEHPHFMEVPLSSSQGLFLRDVINRLNFLRGKGMANHYSWSAKRSYKNGYVWHDLEENDHILPVHSHEYILKGSEILLEPSACPNPISDTPPEETTPKSDAAADNEFPLRTRRRNQSWSAINLHEYKVYKTAFSGELSGKSAATDASTQTDDKRHRKRQPPNACEIVVEDEQQEEAEVSPPPSDSSPETLASLMKAVGNLAPPSDSISASGRRSDRNVKASSILASLISCGSFRDCGAKDTGFSLISHYRVRLPRGGNRAVEEVESVSSGLTSGSFMKMGVEEKEYFSGSLVETRKDEFASLKRSSSYNADRRSQLRLAEKEIDGVRAKCIPRKQKATYPRPPKKEWSDETDIKGSNVP